MERYLTLSDVWGCIHLSINLGLSTDLRLPVGAQSKDKWGPMFPPICLDRLKCRQTLFDQVRYHLVDPGRVNKVPRLISLAAWSDWLTTVHLFVSYLCSTRTSSKATGSSVVTYRIISPQTSSNATFVSVYERSSWQWRHCFEVKRLCSCLPLLSPSVWMVIQWDFVIPSNQFSSV